MSGLETKKREGEKASTHTHFKFGEAFDTDSGEKGIWIRCVNLLCTDQIYRRRHDTEVQ